MKKTKILLVSSIVFFSTLVGTTLSSCGDNTNETTETKFTVTLNFDNTKGTVTASETSGSVGSKVTLTITPKENYEIDTIKINGNSVDNSTREFEPKEGVNTVEVTFKEVSEPVETGTVTLIQAEHGTISASKTSGNVGDEITLTVTPDTGYELEWLKHNNVDITSTKKFNLVKGENRVTVSFKEVNVPVETGTVTLIQAEHGTISASKTSGNVGDEITLTVTPDTGYELEWLKHNDVDITSTKKFKLVKGENKVTVSFKKSLVPENIKTFYFKDVDALNEFGTNAYVYAWNSEDDTIKNATWPGEKLEFVSYDIAHDGANIYTFDLDVANYDTMVLSTKYDDQENVLGQTVNISLTDLDSTSDFYVLSGSQDEENKYLGSFINYAEYLESIKTSVTLDYEKTQGTVTLDKTSYNVGDTVSLTIEPLSGYEIDSVIANHVNLTVEDGKASFIALKNENIVNVTFKEIEEPTIETGTVIIEEMIHGTVEASILSGNVGDEVTLTVTPDTGYELEWLKHNDVDITSTKKFNLVSGENIITASFKKSLVPENLKTFYFKDVDALNEFGTIAYVYAWNSEDDTIKNASWPGEKLEFVSYDIAHDGANIYTFDLDVANYDTMILSTKYDDQENVLGQTIDISISSIEEGNDFIVLNDSKDENGHYVPSYSNYKTYINSIKSTISLTYDDTKGSVSFDDTKEYYAGDTLELTVTPNDGYEVDSVTLNLEEVNLNNLTLVAGENSIVITFKEKVELPEEEKQTIYFKDSKWWNDSAASTRIILFDENKDIITSATDTSNYLGESMTYLDNPGYYNESNYWSYEVDLTEVSYVQFVRASSAGTEDWGAKTDILAISSENNLATLSNEAAWSGDGNYAQVTWSKVELVDITRNLCEVNFTYDDSMGKVNLNGLPFADSTINFTITPNEGYVVDTIKINGEVVDPSTRSLETVKGETYNIEVTFKEGTVEKYTLYFKTISELENWGPGAFAYMFNSTNSNINATWPGEAMTLVSHDETSNTTIWKIEGVDPTLYDTIIFSIGWSDNIVGQTENLSFSNFMSGENNFYILNNQVINDKVYGGEWSSYEA